MIRRLLLAATTALALASCDAPTTTGADGYEFAQVEYSQPSVTVEIVTYETITDLRRAAKAAGHDPVDGRELMAWGQLSRDGKSCTLHVMEPTKRYQPEWIGHEFAHCAWGRWHP